MKIILFIITVVMCMAFNIIHSYFVEKREQHERDLYKEGYDEGHKAGYSKGYYEGYQEGSRRLN